MDYEAIEAAALQLPRAKRADLAERLITSSDEKCGEDDIDAAWTEELKRRVREVDSGEVKRVPGDRVMAEIRTRLQLNHQT
jgi:putative addiction module component (TIGR02574 family)